jgi:hypothetical protein
MESLSRKLMQQGSARDIKVSFHGSSISFDATHADLYVDARH